MNRVEAVVDMALAQGFWVIVVRLAVKLTPELVSTP